MKKSITCLGGTLIRQGRNQWEWSDGTPEPRATDWDPSKHYNFRCRSTGGGKVAVEVLLATAHLERDMLGWVLARVESGMYPQVRSGDHTGPYMLTDEGITRMRIEPDEDPLCGNEPIVHKRAIPLVALVPWEDWEAWALDHPCGALCPPEHSAEFLVKGRSLGWEREGG